MGYRRGHGSIEVELARVQDTLESLDSVIHGNGREGMRDILARLVSTLEERERARSKRDNSLQVKLAIGMLVIAVLEVIHIWLGHGH